MSRTDGYEITLTLGGVADEHVAWTVRALHHLGQLFKLDGSAIDVRVSVERNRDGVERVYEFLSEGEGEVYDQEKNTD